MPYLGQFESLIDLGNAFRGDVMSMGQGRKAKE